MRFMNCQPFGNSHTAESLSYHDPHRGRDAPHEQCQKTHRMSQSSLSRKPSTYLNRNKHIYKTFPTWIKLCAETWRAPPGIASGHTPRTGMQDD